MNKLFVDKIIEINAPTTRVWTTITEPELTSQWAKEFSSGGPTFHIESSWLLGAPVVWKSEDGTVIVEGNVTGLEPNKLLRYTVFDTRSERPPTTDEDGITFELTEVEDNKTTLHVLQGDFSTLADGQKYRDMSAIIWDRVLPTIKRLAEHN